MRALTTTGVAGPDHTLTLQVPADIPPGPRTVVVVLADAPEGQPERRGLKFNPHPVGPVNSMIPLG